MIQRFCVSALLVLLLAGCDTVSSITRTVELPALSPPAAVHAALRAVPEVQTLEYHQVPAVSYWSWSQGTVNEPAYDQYTYRGSDAFGVVEMLQTSEGKKLLRLYCVWMNHIPTRLQVQSTRRLMDLVYNSLQRHLPQVPPAADVTEEYIRPVK